MRVHRYAILFLGVMAAAQTRVDLRTQARDVDFSGATSTRPFKTGTSLPATCATGEMFFKSDVPPGQNLYACTSPNTWTLQTTAVPPLGGDISGTLDAVSVNRLKNRNVSSAAPADGQVLKWNATAGQWEPGTPAGNVSSVMGRTGAVTAQTGDYTAAQVTNAVDRTKANSYAAGTRQTFNPDAASSGLRITPGGLPSSPQPGDLAVDAADSNRLKTYNGTSWSTFTTAAPYRGIFTNATTVTVAAATHGQGSNPFVQCFDNASPANWMLCGYTVAANGDVTLRFSPAQSGSYLVSGATTGVSEGGGGGGAVSSVFGRTGAVTAAAGDYAIGDITGLQTALDGKADVSALAAKADTTALTAHTSRTDNPHQVTAAQAGAVPVDPDYTLVVIPDPQYLAVGGAYTTAYQNLMQWVADNRAAQNIKAVIGVGDIINTAGSTIEESNAWSAWTKIDAAGIPWITPPGNHDYIGDTDLSGRVLDTMWTGTGNFSPAHFAGKSWFGGSYDSSGANWYIRVTSGTRKILILALEFYPRDAVLTWAQGVVNRYPDHEVLLTTHGFLTETCVKAVDTTNFGPNTYNLGGAASNNAQELWDKFIKVNRNITMVLNGHFDTATQTSCHVSESNAFGNTVHEIIVDYQDRDLTYPDKAYMMLLKFRPSQGTVEVSFYHHAPSFAADTINSPYTLTYNPTTALGGGEVNTASNAGSAGVGLFDVKSGADLQFRKLNPASGRITITLDAGNRKVDVDVSEAALNLANIGGTIDASKVAAGSKAGSGSLFQMRGAGSPAASDCAMFDSGGNIVSAGGPCGLATGSNATQIQGRAVASTAPSDGQALKWNGATARWEPGTVASAGMSDPGDNGVMYRSALNTTRPATGADLPVMGASGAGHGAGAVPDPGATAGTTRFLREDGNWQAPPSGGGIGDPGGDGLVYRSGLNTTRVATGSDLPAMAPSGSGHAPGAVPDPGATAGTTRFLREDGTWQAPPAGSGGGGNKVDIQGAASPVTISTSTPTPIFSTTIPGGTITASRCVMWYAAFAPSATGLTYRMYFGSDYITLAPPTNANSQVWSGSVCYQDANSTQITLHATYSTQGLINVAAVSAASDQVLSLKAVGGSGTATVTPHRWILTKVE